MAQPHLSPEILLRLQSYAAWPIEVEPFSSIAHIPQQGCEHAVLSLKSSTKALLQMKMPPSFVGTIFQIGISKIR